MKGDGEDLPGTLFAVGFAVGLLVSAFIAAYLGLPF